MDSILSDTRYRVLFLLSSSGLVLALVLVRHILLPSWNPSLSRGTTEAFAQLTESLVTTLIVTILIGAFVFFVTPAVMRVAKLEPVEPKGINPLLREAALKSIN